MVPARLAPCRPQPSGPSLDGVVGEDDVADMGMTRRASGGCERDGDTGLWLLAAALSLLVGCTGATSDSDATQGGGDQAQSADSADAAATDDGGDGGDGGDSGDADQDAAAQPETLDGATDAADSADDVDAAGAGDLAEDADADAAGGSDGDAALVDAQEAGDTQIDAPTVDACAPYQGCFQCKAPGAGEQVPELPLPATCDCDYGKPKFFKDEPVPAPTLTPTIGYQPYGEAEFVGYQQGGWVGLFVGPQLAFHIWLGLRLSLPQETQDIVKIQVEAAAYDGPKEVATNQAPVQYAYREAPGSPIFRTSKVNLPGSWIQFPVSSLQIYEWCNRWLVIVARVRVFKSSQWGESKVMVRTFANALK